MVFCQAPDSVRNAADYDFSQEQEDFLEDVRLADLLYASFTTVRSTDNLTSHMVKLIGYVPVTRIQNWGVNLLLL